MFACLRADGNLALLLECARRFSPLVEEIPPDAVLLDLQGLEALFGSGESIANRLSNEAGLPVNVAVASNPDAAILPRADFAGLLLFLWAKKRRSWHRFQ
jgi:hypothetical protein